jgi:hypothetical protein
MRETVLRIGLAVLAVPAAVVGVWAGLAPRSFYDDFPGFGQVWVAPDGPFNEHLVRDVGALNLALAVVTIGAAITLATALVRWVLVAWIVEGVMHAAYHSRNLDPFSTSDSVSIMAGLVLVPVVAVALLVVLRQPRSEPVPSPAARSTV